ncbi:MAG: hypothetical protein ACD_47C00029G0002 [uncultured bacterium]|nr:MAG: hypothetical protein ACD_47C00029G0002 [uncultured bacterium]
MIACAGGIIFGRPVDHKIIRRNYPVVIIDLGRRIRQAIVIQYRLIDPAKSNFESVVRRVHIGNSVIGRHETLVVLAVVDVIPAPYIAGAVEQFCAYIVNAAVGKSYFIGHVHFVRPAGHRPGRGGMFFVPVFNFTDAGCRDACVKVCNVVIGVAGVLVRAYRSYLEPEQIDASAVFVFMIDREVVGRHEVHTERVHIRNDRVRKRVVRLVIGNDAPVIRTVTGKFIRRRQGELAVYIIGIGRIKRFCIEHSGESEVGRYLNFDARHARALAEDGNVIRRRPFERRSSRIYPVCVIAGIERRSIAGLAENGRSRIGKVASEFESIGPVGLLEKFIFDRDAPVIIGAFRERRICGAHLVSVYGRSGVSYSLVHYNCCKPGVGGDLHNDFLGAYSGIGAIFPVQQRFSRTYPLGAAGVARPYENGFLRFGRIALEAPYRRGVAVAVDRFGLAALIEEADTVIVSGVIDERRAGGKDVVNI